MIDGAEFQWSSCCSTDSPRQRARYDAVWRERHHAHGVLGWLVSQRLGAVFPEVSVQEMMIFLLDCFEMVTLGKSDPWLAS